MHYIDRIYRRRIKTLTSNIKGWESCENATADTMNIEHHDEKMYIYSLHTVVYRSFYNIYLNAYYNEKSICRPYRLDVRRLCSTADAKSQCRTQGEAYLFHIDLGGVKKEKGWHASSPDISKKKRWPFFFFNKKCWNEKKKGKEWGRGYIKEMAAWRWCSRALICSIRYIKSACI